MRLAEASLAAPRIDNSGANHLGYQPPDSSEPFRAAVEGETPVPDPKSATTRYPGG